MLNITVTVILEKEEGEILTEIDITIILLTIHIQILMVKILIMDTTIKMDIATMDHLMVMVMDMGMEKSELKDKRREHLMYIKLKAQSKIVIPFICFKMLIFVSPKFFE